MASQVAIALMRDTALQRVMDAAQRISVQTGIRVPALPERNRDPDYYHAAQLTALADWAEGVAEGLTPQLELEVEGNPDGSHTSTKNKRPVR